MADGKDKQRNDTIRLLSLITNIGVSTVACILVGVGLGWVLDRFIGTSPLFIIIFTIIGVAAAFKNIYDIGKNIK